MTRSAEPHSPAQSPAAPHTRTLHSRRNVMLQQRRPERTALSGLCSQMALHSACNAATQGEAIPYSFGFYLVCHLVAALNPTDLDALDESVPFTKANPFVQSIAARP